MPDFTEVTPGEKKQPKPVQIGPKAYDHMTNEEKVVKLLELINWKLGFFMVMLIIYILLSLF